MVLTSLEITLNVTSDPPPPHLKKNVWLSFKIDSVAYSDNDSVKEQVLVKCPFKYPQKEDLKGHTYSISLRECLDCGGFTL